MVAGEIVNVPIQGLGGVIDQLGGIGIWIKAVGLFVIIWIVFQSILLWLNWRRWREIGKIKIDMKRIEEKIDSLVAKRK